MFTYYEEKLSKFSDYNNENATPCCNSVWHKIDMQFMSYYDILHMTRHIV